MELDGIFNVTMTAGIFGYIGYSLWDIKREKKRKEQREAAFMGYEIKTGENPPNLDEHNFDTITKDEIAGLDFILERVDQKINVLSHYDEFKKKTHLPMGMLLVGQPGVGKTSIQKYFCSNFPGPIFEIRTDETGRYRDFSNAYDFARKKRDELKKPVGLLIEEFGNDHGNSIKSLLGEMSGINSKRNAGIFLIASTNHDIKGLHLDYSIRGQESPLFRPGRLEVVTIGSPSLEAKIKIFEMNLAKEHITYNDNCSEIARFVPTNETGAFIEYIIDEAVQNKMKTSLDMVTINNMDLLYAINSMLTGNKQDSILNEKQKREVARHEIGHYLVAKELKYEISFVSIDKHATSLGYTNLVPNDNHVVCKLSDLKNRMMVFMGGYMMDKLHDEMNANSLNDIINMGKIYHYIQALENRGQKINSNHEEEYFKLIPRHVLNRSEDQVQEILNSYENKLESLIDLVVSKGTVNANDLDKIIA